MTAALAFGPRVAASLLLITARSLLMLVTSRRVTNAEIGAFNKGAFQLAAALGVTMKPLFIHIPREIDPGKGWHARLGAIHVHVGKPMDISAWRAEDAAIIKEQVRYFYVRRKDRLDG